MPHGRIALSSSASRGELRFARAPRRASTRPRVIWRLVASRRVVKSCVLALRARPRSLRSPQNAPRCGVDESCVLVIGEPWRTSLRSCAPSRLDSPALTSCATESAPSRLDSPALTSFATECAPLRLDSPALTSCATECAPSRLDSPAAHFVRYRMRPVAPRLARRACPIVAIERLCFASIVH